MNYYLNRQPRAGKRLTARHLAAGWLMIITVFAAQIGTAASNSELPAARDGSAGAVLLQHSGSAPALGLQSFSPNGTAARWTALSENAHGWRAAAMDGSRVLFFRAADASLALCTLDEAGAPSRWLPLDSSVRGFVPVALEKETILLQSGPGGALKKITFNKKGHLVSSSVISADTRGWVARGMHANRIALEHAESGEVIIWATNPTVPLCRPYKSFMIPDGWSVRDFAGDFVLIQQGETGPIQLVELGDDYQAKKNTELVSATTGWRAVALAK